MGVKITGSKNNFKQITYPSLAMLSKLLLDQLTINGGKTPFNILPENKRTFLHIL